MSNDDTIIGPIQLDAHISFVNPEGAIATVKFGFAVGRPVTEEDLRRAVEVSAQRVPDDFKLMGPDTFFNHVLVKQRTGRHGNFAVPHQMRCDWPGLEMAEGPRLPVDDEDDEDDED